MTSISILKDEIIVISYVINGKKLWMDNVGKNQSLFTIRPLSAIEEVPELCLPDGKVVGWLDGHAVLEAEHCLLREDAVGYLQFACDRESKFCWKMTIGKW